jgi:hypothetical protein
MVQQRQQRFCGAVVTRFVVALASTFMACSFTPPTALNTPENVHKILNMTPVRSLEEGNRWTVYEDPGRIRVQHGYGCTQVSEAATDDYVGFHIQDQAVAPDVNDHSAIILNGWDLQYRNGDHHVQGLGSAIFNISHKYTINEYTLQWDAGGVLSDKNGDDDYKWCYRYTLIFWNASVFDTSAFQFDYFPYSTTFVDSDYVNGTALKEIQGKFTVPDDKYSLRGVLPRGFGLSWYEDHEVLQVGFDLGTPPLGGTPVVSGNEITWTSQTVLKDDATLHSYNAAELVTILSGESVEMWQPRQVLHLKGNPPDWVPEPTQLILKPAEPCGFTCNGNGNEEHLEFYSVENVPYDYAIPVLTGWDMQYATEDHHVERIGVYLVEFDYVKDPNAATGTLNYTIFSTMRDDSDNGHYDPKYKVSVLGFNALGGGSEK